MSSDYDGLERELAEIEEEDGARMPTKAARVLPMMVAAVALLSFGAIIYYAYNRGLTTGTEVAAPLIKPEGPAKVKPADPGGLEVPHRDKLVYGTLDKSADDSRVEQLLPPPEDPMHPPTGAQARQSGTQLLPQREVPLPSVTGAGEAPAEPLLPAPELAAPTAPPPQAGTDEEVAADGTEGQAEEAPAQVSSAVGPFGTRSGGTAMSGTPAEAPRQVASASARKTEPEPLEPANGKAPDTPAAAETKAPAQKPAEKVAKAAPAKAAPGGAGWRIQIASVRSADAAETEWQRHRKAHPQLLGKLDLTVKRVELADKGTFYRVQGGPLKDKTSAQRLCTELKSKKVGCLVVKP